MLPRHLHWPHRIGSAGTKGAWQGVSGARRGLRHEAAVQEGEERRGKKGRGEFAGKAAGDKRLYTCRKAGGEGGHGAVKPERIRRRNEPASFLWRLRYSASNGIT